MSQSVMQKPSIGRIVIVKNVHSNSADEQAAIITRAWSDTCVNVTAFLDAASPGSYTSVYFFQDRAAAEAFISTQPFKAVVAFWPDRV